jgi:hypothetical protein
MGFECTTQSDCEERIAISSPDNFAVAPVSSGYCSSVLSLRVPVGLYLFVISVCPLVSPVCLSSFVEGFSVYGIVFRFLGLCLLYVFVCGG